MWSSSSTPESNNSTVRVGELALPLQKGRNILIQLICPLNHYCVIIILSSLSHIDMWCGFKKRVIVGLKLKISCRSMKCLNSKWKKYQYQNNNSDCFSASTLNFSLLWNYIELLNPPFKSLCQCIYSCGFFFKISIFVTRRV